MDQAMDDANETSSKRIHSVQLFKYTPHNVTLRGRKVAYYHVFFLGLYLYQTYWCVSTIGQPYREFLERAEFLGLDVMEGATALRSTLNFAIQDIDNPDRVDSSKMGWFDYLNMDIEEANELKRKQKKEKAGLSILEQNLPKNMKVPNKNLPTFNAMFVSGVVVTLHVLVILLQVWLVKVKLFMNYQSVKSYDDEEKLGNIANGQGMVVLIKPSKGRALLSPVSYCQSLGLSFEYSRRKFVLDMERRVWNKISPPKTIPLKHFNQWNGHTDDSAARATIMFGANCTDIKVKSFKDLYLEQLVSPFTVFQLFCTLLWCLDSYLTYSLFSFFMILTFEGTVVFQRMKSVQALSTKSDKTAKVEALRDGEWNNVLVENLVPGDLVKLNGIKDVPADCVILQGQCVVNEASLTGESVPQFRESLVLGSVEDEEILQIKSDHKLNVLYAGTTLLQSSSNLQCYILRTGFTHSGGKLVRMMEQTQSSATSSQNQREVGLLLLFLFVFALISSGYVLQHGRAILAEDGIFDHKVQYSLLLHCILILTSVIPPELPMQMSLTINTCLMSLMKTHIFCTDPNKVPISGMVDYALFDKTGTLTSDELICVGLCSSSKTDKNSSGGKNEHELVKMNDIDGSAKLVIAGCHTLFSIPASDDDQQESKKDSKSSEKITKPNDSVQGDPMELAAFKAINWTVSSTADSDSSNKSDKTPEISPNREKSGSNIKLMNGKTVSSVKILHRHHFNSTLQRMSCVIECNDNLHCVVAKGSPEAIYNNCLKGGEGAPDETNYLKKAQGLAKSGLRVIALATKYISTDDLSSCSSDRVQCESQMNFAGFLCFGCQVRKDTKAIVQHLKAGGIEVIMITGDAVLTAIHVAREVDLLTSKSLTSSKTKFSDDSAKIALLQLNSAKPEWVDLADESVSSFTTKSIGELFHKGYTLATTGPLLPHIPPECMFFFSIFARCKPKDKEFVISCLQHNSTTNGGKGNVTCMCGDGANDVGALRSADVGVALLSGFGNVNVDKDDTKKEDSNSTALITADQMKELQSLPVKEIKKRIRDLGDEPDKYPINTKEDLIQLYRKRSVERAVAVHDKSKPSKKALTPAEKRAKAQEEARVKQEKIQRRVAELEAAGESWATFKAMKEFMAEEQAAAKAKKAEMSKYRSVEGSAAKFIQQMEDLDDVPQIKIGDASMAAPFTSKLPSIRSVVDIIRQGRCTLVTSMQMYQILALNSLISAYSLSVLYLDGVKYGDVQMTGMGILMSITYMSVSRSKPLDQLSPVKPLTSIFHPSMFISLLFQFAVHLFTMIYAVQCAKVYLEDDYKIDLDGEFKPGIVNSVVFLISCVQQVTVFVVNLQGRPFMTGLTENRPLLWSLIATFILTFMFASETVPSLNKYMQLVPFPDEEFRNFILWILAADVGACLVLDRLMKFIFAPKILYASLAGTTLKDVLSLGRTIGVIVAFMHMMIGDNEQWEELMKEEGRLEELGLNATNSTVISDETMGTEL